MLSNTWNPDYGLDVIFPNDTGEWSRTPTTWDTWNTWFLTPANPLIFRTPRQRVMGNLDFNLKIETIANGTVSYEVYTSTTGAFNGEETSTSVAAGASNVSGFHGQYYMIDVVVYQTIGTPTISAVQITATDKTISQTLNDLSTSTLGGTITARQLPITRNFSLITTIDVQAKEVTAYALDLYVSNYATSKTVIPRVVSKNRTTPTIALMGIDGSNKEGTVDVVVTGLPEQYMSGNNLLIR
jgi:hypothetical protein